MIQQDCPPLGLGEMLAFRAIGIGLVCLGATALSALAIEWWKARKRNGEG